MVPREAPLLRLGLAKTTHAPLGFLYSLSQMGWLLGQLRLREASCAWFV